MHKFFELVSIGEEIIQEAKPNFLTRMKKGAGKAYGAAGDAAKGAAASAGRGAARVGKGIAPYAGKAGGKFIKKHPKAVGAGALALGAAGAGGAAFGGSKLFKKQESDIQEGKLGFLAQAGEGISKFGGSVKRDVGTLGRLGKAGMKGRKGGIFNAASMMAGSRAGKRSLMRGGIGAAGIGGAAYGGSKLFGRQESELPELSAKLQDQFLTKLTEGKGGLFKKAGEAAKSGFKFASKKGKKAYKAVGAAAGGGPPWVKKNPVKTGLGALAVGGAVGGGVYAKKKFGK